MAAMSDAPRVSVVVTTRNDDHGGGLLRRTQIFVDGLLEQARRHGLNGELIVVEWNPPPDRPRLADAFRWPEQSGPCRVRIIEVPAEIHCRFRYADRLGLFQMIAKNVGIRRARGQFVLSTNIDLLFSDQMVQFLASRPLDANAMYRTDRFDVSADVPVGAPVGQQLDFCRRNILRICTRWGTFIPGELRWFKVLKLAGNRILDTRVRDLPWLLSVSLRRFMRKPLHTNACGDFTLLARERWFALRGHPELEMFSLHLDSVLCQMASAGGAREVVLGDEMRAYHIDHGSGWSSGDAERLAARMAALGVPILESGQYRVWVEEARRRQAPIIFNGEDWGLAKESLVEIDPLEGASGLKGRTTPAERVQA